MYPVVKKKKLFEHFSSTEEITDILNSNMALISDQVGSIITDMFVYDFCFTNILKCTLSSWSRILSEKQMAGNQVQFSAFCGL